MDSATQSLLLLDFGPLWRLLGLNIASALAVYRPVRVPKNK